MKARVSVDREGFLMPTLSLPQVEKKEMSLVLTEYIEGRYYGTYQF